MYTSIPALYISFHRKWKTHCVCSTRLTWIIFIPLLSMTATTTWKRNVRNQLMLRYLQAGKKRKVQRFQNIIRHQEWHIEMATHLHPLQMDLEVVAGKKDVPSTVGSRTVRGLREVISERSFPHTMQYVEITARTCDLSVHMRRALPKAN